eukprot:CAMPEP_0113507290 /NCGR_PEP_ID=MMETSP0014_2-20120614/36381_1 /TAXON_ID=2857 /ORGANISM="Nitzschia sp." /LENGTH=816 /DNA_ID=CAMNT_0000402879 /DNA_START=176 /DNA_END=2626 /DNA_ORIENTATION=+ /assembly_acc=CAM_ASM_000159
MSSFHDIITPFEQSIPSSSSTTTTSNNITNISNSSRSSSSSNSSSSSIGGGSGGGKGGATGSGRLQQDKDEPFLTILDFHQYGYNNNNHDFTPLGQDLDFDRGHFDIDMEINPADHVGLDGSNTDGKGTTGGDGSNNDSSMDGKTTTKNVVAGGNSRGPTMNKETATQLGPVPVPADNNMSSSEDVLAMMKGKELKPPPPPPPTSKSDSTPTIKNTTKKRTWKKPHDKPKRPLSSYNIYFQHQRERLVEEKSGEATPEEVVASVEGILARGKTKRRHRKSHGKISFGDLARSIADSWKTVCPKNKAIFDHYAERDMLRYKRELKVWRDKKDLEIEADAQARHSKFMSSMGSSFSGSVNSEVSISFSQLQASTSDCVEGHPDEGVSKMGGVLSSSFSNHRGRHENTAMNASLSSLESQRSPIPRARRGSMTMKARLQSTAEGRPEHSSPVASNSIVQRQQHILKQQMMLDRSNNSNSMNMSLSSHHSEQNQSSNLQMMGPSSVHSTPSGMAMGMNMNMNMMGSTGMNRVGGPGSMGSVGPNAMMGAENAMSMRMNAGMNHGTNFQSGFGSMSFQQPNPMGIASSARQDNNFQNFQQQQFQQQQLQHQQNMAMLHSSSNSLQFVEDFGGSAGGDPPNIVSDHTRTSMGHQSTQFNNSQASFAAFGNSMSSFGGSSMMYGGPSMMPTLPSSLSSRSYHGGTVASSNGMWSQTQQMGGNRNFPMMSQQVGMSSSSFQRRQQGQGLGKNSNSNAEAKGSTTANTNANTNTNTNLISSASYHSGMRPASMHRTLQQETIDEHSQHDLDYESSFAFPSGEGFY